MSDSQIITLTKSFLKKFNHLHHYPFFSKFYNALQQSLTAQPRPNDADIIGRIKKFEKALIKKHRIHDFDGDVVAFLEACRIFLLRIEYIYLDNLASTQSKIFRLAVSYIHFISDRGYSIEILDLKKLFSITSSFPTDEEIIHTALRLLTHALPEKAKMNKEVENLLLSFLAQVFVELYGEKLASQQGIVKLAYECIRKILKVVSSRKIIDLASRVVFEPAKFNETKILILLKNFSDSSLNKTETEAVKKNIDEFLQSWLGLLERKNLLLRMAAEIIFDFNEKQLSNEKFSPFLSLFFNSNEKNFTNSEVIKITQALHAHVSEKYFSFEKHLSIRLKQLLNSLRAQIEAQKNNRTPSRLNSNAPQYPYAITHNQSHSFFHQLPSPVLLEIFKFNNLVDLSNLNRSSRYLREVLHSSEIFQKTLMLKQPRNYKHPSFFSTKLNLPMNYGLIKLISNQRLVLAKNKQCCIYNIFTSKKLHSIALDDDISHLTFTKNNYLAIGTATGKIYFYETNEFNLSKVITYSEGKIHKLFALNNDRLFIQLNKSGTFISDIWDLTPWQPIASAVALKNGAAEKNKEIWLNHFSSKTLTVYEHQLLTKRIDDSQHFKHFTKNGFMSVYDNGVLNFLHTPDEPYSTSIIPFKERSEIKATLTINVPHIVVIKQNSFEIRSILEWNTVLFSKTYVPPLQFLDADSAGNIVMVDQEGIHAYFFHPLLFRQTQHTELTTSAPKL